MNNKTWSMPIDNTSKKETVPCVLCSGNEFIHHLNCDDFGYVKCKKCSLVQMNPQPAKDILYDRYSKTYGKDYLQYELNNELNFLALQLLALKDSGLTLEPEEESLGANKDLPLRSFLYIGCATGTLLDYMRGKGWKVCGVEISPSTEYAVKYRGLDVKSIPLEEIKFPDNSFDVVYASHLIEHLKDPDLFIKEVKRILKPKGCLLLITPNIAGLQAKLFGHKWRSAIFDHLYLFSKRTLKKILRKNGFIIQRVRTWGGLAIGTAPLWLKKIADKLAKTLGFGDVMLIKTTNF